MSEPVQNAYTIFIILCIGFTLRQCGVLDRESVRRFTFVIMYITLPCAILSSAQGLVFDAALLFVVPISFVFNLVLLYLPYWRHDPSRWRMFCMYTLAGFNVGNFMLPFMQSMLTPRAFLALALFDLVNALFIFGGSYSAALWCNRQVMPGEAVSPGAILKELSKSFPTYAYLIAIGFSIYHVSIPDFVMHPVMTIGRANTFVCMLIIGTALSVKMPKGDLRELLHILLMRYSVGIVLAAAVWFLLPLARDIRIILVLLALAPMASINSVTTLRKMPEHAGISADLVSVSLLISLVVVTVMTTLLPFGE